MHFMQLTTRQTGESASEQEREMEERVGEREKERNASRDAFLFHSEMPPFHSSIFQKCNVIIDMARKKESKQAAKRLKMAESIFIQMLAMKANKLPHANNYIFILICDQYSSRSTNNDDLVSCYFLYIVNECVCRSSCVCFLVNFFV